MAWSEWVSVRTPVHTALKLITPPAIEPFTIAEAKLHAKIETDADNALVTKWIRAARSKVERDTQRALLTQTWDLLIDGFAGWSDAYAMRVPYPPLQSITSVNATDTAGAETVWAASNYVVDTASEPGRIALTDAGTWPSSLRLFQPGRIRFVAGWTTPSAIPADLVEAMALLIGWYSENRQPEAMDTQVYDASIAPYVIFQAA